MMRVRRSGWLAMAGALVLLGCGGGSGGSTGGGVGVAPAPAPAPSPAPSPSPSPAAGPLTLTGDLRPVHDPAVIRVDGRLFLFATGHVGEGAGPTPMRTSEDGLAWTLRGAVFPTLPSWAATTVPGTRGLWAPDISFSNGEYRLYYSVSTFGSNRSAIGLATARSLDPAAPSAGWTDKGIVVQSQPSDDYNAIDPNIFDDADGRRWMAFGSFWSGIKMIRIDPATGLRAAGDTTVHAVAGGRPTPNAIEAPFVIRRDGFYYMFVSFDFCCRGANSTYATVVGRSASPTGPYVDREGRAMLQGGGTSVLPAGTGERFVGRGHVAILRETDGDFIVYHAYDTQNDGTPTLRIQRLRWTADGWPEAQ